MLKFIRGKAQQPSADRQRLQKELFAFRKVSQNSRQLCFIENQQIEYCITRVIFNLGMRLAYKL